MFISKVVSEELATWKDGRNRICHSHQEYVTYAGTFTRKAFENALREIDRNVEYFRDQATSREFARQVANCYADEIY
jgi:hypothetical protein